MLHSQSSTHISRSPAGITAIVLFINSCNSKVSDSDVSSCIKDQILRLDVTVDNVILLQILKAQNDAGNKEL